MAPLAVRGLKAALNSAGKFKFKVSPSLNTSLALGCWMTRILESRCSGRLSRYWRRCGHTLFKLHTESLNLQLGVIGLAIARRLSERFPTKSTFLVERHVRAGEEIRCVYAMDFYRS